MKDAVLLAHAESHLRDAEMAIALCEARLRMPDCTDARTTRLLAAKAAHSMVAAIWERVAREAMNG